MASNPIKKAVDNHWMEKAFANSHGQFKAKARRAGMSTGAYARKKAGAPGRLGKQARLAEIGMKAQRGGASESR